MAKKEGKIRPLLSVLTVLAGLVLISIPVSASALSITRENVIDFTNQTRTDQGLNLLNENSNLTEAAQSKAQDMISRGYWAHFYQGEKPWDWMKKAGYRYTDAGENLAIDFSEIENMHEAWLESASHRENLLNSRYQDIGVGVAEGWFKDHNTIIVVQMFGRPQVSKQVRGTDSQPQASLNQDLSREDLVGVETEAITGQEKAGSLTRALNWIGEKSVGLWNTIKNAGQDSLAWLGSKILPGYYVLAD